MSRRRAFFQFSGRLGDLERYGLLALVAALLLAVAFVAQTIAGDVAPFRSMAFRGAAERIAAARSAAAATVADADAGSDSSTLVDEPGGGETPAPPGATARPREVGFDFYEPPVRVPGKAPVVAPPPPGPADGAAGSVRTVRVRRGETLQKIAARELGAASRWRVLVDWNPGVDPKKLQPGMELKLPVARSAPKEVAAAAEHVYTVAREETLESIAERQYGDRSRWIDLLEANRDQLSAPAGLRAGMKIRIP